MIFDLPVILLHSFKAASTASVPEFVRYTEFKFFGKFSTNKPHKFILGSSANSPYTITWEYFFNWFIVALITLLSEWPRLQTDTPATKSKYFFFLS